MARNRVSDLGVWQPFDCITFEPGSSFPTAIECNNTSISTADFLTTPAPPFGPQTTVARFSQKKAGHQYITVAQDLSTNSNLVFSGYVYLDDSVWPPSNGIEMDLVTFHDISNGNCMKLRLVAVGIAITLQLFDANNNVIASTIDTGFSDEAWVRIDIYVQTVASGDCIVHIDGVEKFNVSAQDFDPGGITAVRCWIEGQGGSGPTASPTTVYWACFYWGNFAERGASDFIGDWTILTYKIGNDGVVPDCDATGASPGTADNLDSSEWDIASDGTNANGPLYSGSNDQGAVRLNDVNDFGVPGPTDDATVSKNNDPIMGKWLWLCTGSTNNTHTNVIHGYYSTDGAVHIVTDTDTTMIRNNASWNIVNKYDAIPTRVPSMDNEFIIGFKKDTISVANIYLREVWCFLIVKAPYVTGGKHLTTVKGNSKLQGNTLVY